jgi:hypothetical protein
MEPMLEAIMDRQMAKAPHILQKALWRSSVAVKGGREMWEEVLLHRLIRNVLAFQPGRD